MARRKQEPWYAFAAAVLRPTLTLLTRRDWDGTEELPAEVAQRLSECPPINIYRVMVNAPRNATEAETISKHVRVSWEFATGART